VTARQQWGLVLGAVALLGAALFAATRLLGDELFPVTVGSRAPDFRAATLDAAPRVKTLADYRGRVVLLNVWATWCAPCRVEMPSIERLHRELGPRGLAVVAVSIDDPGTDDAIRDFAHALGLTFEILHDAPGTIQRTYQTSGVPETFVIGPDGVIRKKVIGAADWASDANRALFARLLEEAGAARPARDGGAVAMTPR
jgi:cytochrome c biogenesis protein CcmG, thiol:disulfide interchange protein DsbE